MANAKEQNVDLTEFVAPLTEEFALRYWLKDEASALITFVEALSNYSFPR